MYVHLLGIKKKFGYISWCGNIRSLVEEKEKPNGLGFMYNALLLAIRLTIDLLLFDEVPEAEHFIPSFFWRTLEVLEK